MSVRVSSLKAAVVLITIAASAATGCKDQAKCDDAFATARKAMQDEFLDMDLARQWRDHAGKICGSGTDLSGLDKEILDKEAAIAKAIADAAQKAADDGQAALKKAEKLWKGFDKLDEKEQDTKALKKIDKKAKTLVNGLTPEYAKQVEDFNKKKYKALAKKLKDKK